MIGRAAAGADRAGAAAGDDPRLAEALAVAAVLAGAWFRLKGLGVAPLAIDEYYVAAAVESVRERGLPKLACGGYYTRGLLLQYLSAPLLGLPPAPEAWLRAVPVVSNLLVLPALYLLARELIGREAGGRTAGAIAVALFSLSVWETEMARFARMYAPFQALFVWHLLYLRRALARPDEAARGRARWAMYALSATSILVYEGAVFLVALNFVALARDRARAGLAHLAVPPALFVLAYLYIRTDFRHLGAPPALPGALRGGGAGGSLPLDLPRLMHGALGDAPVFLALLVALVLAGAALVIGEARARRGRPRSETLPAIALPALLVALGTAHQYALAALVLACAWLAGGCAPAVDPRAIPPRRRVALSAWLAASVGFWVAFARLGPGGAGVESWRALAVALAGYPDALREIALPWLGAMPATCALAALAIAAGVAGRLVPAGAPLAAYRGSAALLLGLGALTAALAQPYVSIRYTFFLYPPVLVLMAVPLAGLARRAAGSPAGARLAPAAVLVAAVLVSDDVSFAHLLQVDGERAIYRTGYTDAREEQLYTRWDFRGPAEHVNRHAAPGDTIIVSDYSLPWYLERLDHVYVSAQAGRFRAIACDRGRRDVWTGAALLYRPAQLLDALAAATGASWLIVRSPRYPYRYDAERLVAERYTGAHVLRSRDGYLDVYRIPARAGG